MFAFECGKYQSHVRELRRGSQVRVPSEGLVKNAISCIISGLLAMGSDLARSGGRELKSRFPLQIRTGIIFDPQSPSHPPRWGRSISRNHGGPTVTASRG
jgi:hypothetical protein